MSHAEKMLTTPRTWYLPHHPVFNPNKPDKVRMVFDSAATYKGVSLNSKLVTGPDLLNDLAGVQLRFRTHPIAITGDIEAMYHQVHVPLADSDSLRFLWTSDVNSNDEPDTLHMLVHVFGAKDSPACANFALKTTARDNQQNFDPQTYESVIKSFYMDDLLKSVKTETEAIKLALELVEMLKRGGFRLHKFLSNSKSVMDALPSSERTVFEFTPAVEDLQRALGICWDVVNDILRFHVRNFDASALVKILFMYLHRILFHR